MPNVYHCDGCALCCRHLIIEANAADALREPRIIAADPHPDTGTRIALDVTQVAFILNGRDGDMTCRLLDAAGRCEVYPTRPGCCVEFQAGGAKCRELREDYGLAPLEPVESDALPDLIAAAVREAIDGD